MSRVRVVAPPPPAIDDPAERDSTLTRWRRRLIAPIDHEAVVARVVEESGWSPRYLFMTLMSAGIAVLGLLLSSPAVVIGAMLISPLMSPILGLGFSVAMFDFAEMRRSLLALIIGTVAGVGFTAAIVLLSPLKETTGEILARTRPNLFDLMVAMFAALAGSFALIRGRGETIAGVAIATALMPPLAVVGYGLATGNTPVLTGALALYATNALAIALSAAAMARYWGFGHGLSPQQSWTQTLLLMVAFAAMAVPLAIALQQIASEAIVTSKVRSLLADRFGPDLRVSQLDLDFDRRPLTIRAVVIAPRSRAVDHGKLQRAIAQDLGRPVTAQVDQVLLARGATALDAQRAEVQRAKETTQANAAAHDIAAMTALAAGVAPDQVTVDPDHHRVAVAAAALPGATLASYRALEARIGAASPGWAVTLTPPLLPLPTVSFAAGQADLTEPGRDATLTAIWAARRWNAGAIEVSGLGEPGMTAATLTARRAAAVAGLIREQHLEPVPARASAGPVTLAIRSTPKAPQ